MLRKVAILVISAGLTMSPLSVQALGFGGIKLKSSLNERLNAEVALLSANENDIQSLTINLATEEAFLRSGIDRTALLNKLKFKVKQRANGDYYIQVTTTETVREPFMNFLLELNWKNGRMLREYTMLIDPPRRAPKHVAAPAPVMAETMAPEVKAEVVPEPVIEEPVVAEVEEPSPFVEPVAEPAPMPELMPEPAEAVVVEEVVEPEVFVEPVVEMVEPDLSADIPPPVEMAAAEVEEPAVEIFDPESAFVDEDTSGELWPRIPLTAYSESDEDISEEEPVYVDAESSGEMGDLDYGIIKAGDNLWNIAEKLRQGDESVSVHQVMMALLQNNPDAFVDNNVHRLKVGHVLRIDDPSALTSMSRKEAANAYVEQTGAWNNYRQQVAEAAGIQPIMAGDNIAATDTEIADTSGELTLSSPDGESLTAGGGGNEESLNNDLATMQDQLRQAKSDAGTMRTRNVALNDKLQSLEDELNRLQRSISVKDDELAALQQQLSSLDQQPVKVPVQQEMMPAETPVVAEVTPELVEEPVVTEEPEKAEVTEPTAEPAEQVKPEKSPVELAAEIAVQEKAKTPADAEQGIMDTVMGVVASIGAIFAGLNLGSDSLLFIAAPILLVLLIIVVIVIKRRRQGENFQESILTGAATASAATGDNTISGDSTTFSEESSFLSDFAMSGASAIEADDSEVDPLTEADVFMAYGRYEAAEERLNEAIQNEPARMELRAKLLELYHATQNKDAFESSAEDFYASLGGAEAENPLWAKVVGMGTEIAPENPLFNQGGGAVADIAATGEVPAIDDIGMGMTDSQVMDIGLETGVFAAADLSASAESSSDDMDFNLDLGESAAAEPEAAEMDFNLDIGGGDALATEEEPAADLDFNLDMGTTDLTEDLVTEDAGLDFNLDVGDEVAAEESAADLDLNLDMGTTDSADDSGLDFNLDIGGDEGSLDLNLDAADTADADLGGSDEVGTKLDLAKAYIDMGDPEGARSILDEVMDEGSSTQKEEAQSLLGQIA